MDDSIKHVEINGRKFCVVRMSAFDAIHFNLRVAEILAKHGISEFLDSWDAVNTNFTAANIADVYLVALECLKLSILPVTAGLKKNIGLDTAGTMQGAMRQLFSALLKTLTEPSAQNLSSGE